MPVEVCGLFDHAALNIIKLATESYYQKKLGAYPTETIAMQTPYTESATTALRLPHFVKFSDAAITPGYVTLMEKI